jgi:hypothetical protein
MGFSKEGRVSEPSKVTVTAHCTSTSKNIIHAFQLLQLRSPSVAKEILDKDARCLVAESERMTSTSRLGGVASCGRGADRYPFCTAGQRTQTGDIGSNDDAAGQYFNEFGEGSHTTAPIERVGWVREDYADCLTTRTE